MTVRMTMTKKSRKILTVNDPVDAFGVEWEEEDFVDEESSEWADGAIFKKID